MACVGRAHSLRCGGRQREVTEAIMQTFRLARLAFGAAAILAAAVSFADAQQRFKTPEQAADALVAAARAGDRRTIAQVLGPGSGDIVSSGDPVQDANTRQEFLTAYEASHRVVTESGKPAILVVGPSDWPFPIPIVEKDGEWQFDTLAGREEILARRIGRNELATIQTVLAYYDAQNEYAEVTKDKNGIPVYAQRIISSPGKKDGLYWPTAEGQADSPLGDAVAAATRQGYRVGGGQIPYHGYYYKILTRQGPTAPGGALDYVVRGSMIGGFALVAYPAEYGNSGVMTFLVTHKGEVFEKDLGPGTAKIAGGMTSFNPDQTWKKVATTEEKR
jgi:hypothetical protein